MGDVFKGYAFDTMVVQLPEVSKAIRDGKEIDWSWKDTKTASKTISKLIVEIIATHSGLIINNRVYPGVAMEKSTPTWTVPYAKPVSKGHPTGGFFGGGDSEPPVLGRVTKVDYIRTIDKDQWKNDWKNPATSGRGSGHIKLTAEISDEDAIIAILDKRMLTVSQGCQLHAAVCNICGCDWITNRYSCEHSPGRVYEVAEPGQKDKTKKVKCYLIAGPMTYDHCAIVNSPASPHAMITSMKTADNIAAFGDVGPVSVATVSAISLVDENGPTQLCITDAKELPDYVGEAIYTALIPLPALDDMDTVDKGDPVEEGAMKKYPKKQDAKPDEDETKELPTVTPEVKPDESDTKPDEKPDEKPTETPDKGRADGDELKEGEETEEKPDKGDSLQLDKATYDTADLLVYGSIIDAIEINDSVPELERITFDWASAGIDEAELEHIKTLDRVLTADPRKKLKDSSFCGPNRTFPVLDCSQYDRAKACLVYASVENKASIRTDIEQKGKALKCSTVDKKGGDAEETKKTKDEVRSLTKQIENLKASLDAKNAEQTQLLDQFAEVDSAMRVRTAESVVLMRQMLGREEVEFSNDEAMISYVSDLASREMAYLGGTYFDLKVEVSKIYGISLIKPGTVLDPTLQPVVDKSDKKSPDDNDDVTPPRVGTREWQTEQFQGVVDDT